MGECLVPLPLLQGWEPTAWEVVRMVAWFVLALIASLVLMAEHWDQTRGGRDG